MFKIIICSAESLYALIRDDQRYYLAAYSDFREKVVTFRVDHMCDVEVMDEAAVKDEGFNAAEFANSTFKMIDEGLPEAEVTLLCDNVFMQNVVDRFGEGIETETVDEEAFRASVTVRPSKTFFSWVVGFCGGIRIAGGYNAVTYELELPGIDDEMAVCVWKDGHVDSGSMRSICDCLASR